MHEITKKFGMEYSQHNIENHNLTNLIINWYDNECDCYHISNIINKI